MSQSQNLSELHTFRRQYLQGLSTSKLTYPKVNVLRQSGAQAWLYKYIFSSGLSKNDDMFEKGITDEDNSLANNNYAHQRSFAAPERYQLRVLKEVVGSIERAIRMRGTDDDVRWVFHFYFILRMGCFCSMTLNQGALTLISLILTILKKN